MNDTRDFTNNNKTFCKGIDIHERLEEIDNLLEDYAWLMSYEDFNKLNTKEIEELKSQVLSMNYKLMDIWHESVRVYREFENKRERLR